MFIRSIIVWVLASAAVAWGQAYPESAGSGSIDTYEGPSVLSRSGSSVTGERAGRLIDFEFWGDVNGIYDSGLAGLIVGPNGKLEQTAGDYGIDVGGGVVGTRTWQNDQVTIDYTGDFRHYTPNSYYDGTNQFLQFQWKHTLARHWSMELHELGGITSLSYGTLSYAPVRTDEVGLPTDQLFDNTAYFDQTGGELYWQKSARLSFGFGGDGFLIDYRASPLADTRGADAKADAVYRLSRRQKIYLTYKLMRYDYQRIYGFSTTNMGAAGYSVDLGRDWSVELQGGAFYVNSNGLIQVPVSPAIAIVIGTSYTTTTADRRVIIPDAEGRLTRRFRRSAVDLGGAETVAPGNGVYLTSRAESGYAHYSFVGSKRLTLGGTAAYSTLSAIGQQNLGKFASYSGGAGAVYRLFNNVHGELRCDFYHYTTQNAGYKQNEQRVTIGLAFSSGDRPLAIW